jgi:hypothetical protein
LRLTSLEGVIPPGRPGSSRRTSCSICW